MEFRSDYHHDEPIQKTKFRVSRQVSQVMEQIFLKV